MKISVNSDNDSGKVSFTVDGNLDDNTRAMIINTFRDYLTGLSCGCGERGFSCSASDDPEDGDRRTGAADERITGSGKTRLRFISTESENPEEFLFDFFGNFGIAD